MPDRVILASASPTRRRLLEAARLEFSATPSSVDEQAVREALGNGPDALVPADLAEVLARAKAEDVSRRHPEALVIGADQVLAVEARVKGKPRDRDEARAILLDLKGRTHELHSAVTIAQAGVATWSAVDTAHLTMRSFSADFLAYYLERAGSAAIGSLGAYLIEDLGSQLFEAVEGDYFTILGLPLLPLLEELRRRGVMMR
jgi:septum formation protein